MRRLIIAAGILTALVLAALWATGGFALIAAEAAAAQRTFQTAIAGALRRLKAGDAGAIAALLAVAFGYGVVHAVGPGHGKVLLGGYAMGSRAGWAKLAWLSLVSSLAQATVAVVLVYAGVLVAGWTRDQLGAVAQDWFAPVSAVLIALIGLWLAARGIRHLRAATRTEPGHGHDHGHDHDHDHDHGHGHHPHGHGCGHAHGPSADDVARVADLRTAAALVAGIALRPCTGALFLLVLTWQMGIAGAGIAGTYAMGLGTALVTIAVALAAAFLRDGFVEGLGRSRALVLALPVLEIAAGLAIAAIAMTLAARPL